MWTTLSKAHLKAHRQKRDHKSAFFGILTQVKALGMRLAEGNSKQRRCVQTTDASVPRNNVAYVEFPNGLEMVNPGGGSGSGLCEGRVGGCHHPPPTRFPGFLFSLGRGFHSPNQPKCRSTLPPPLLSLLLDGLWRGDDPWGSNQASLRTASEPYDVQSLDRTTGSSHFYRAILNACMCLCLRTRPPARMAVCATHRQPS